MEWGGSTASGQWIMLDYASKHSGMRKGGGGVEEKEKREEREKRLFSLQSYIIKSEYSWRICSKIRF